MLQRCFVCNNEPWQKDSDLGRYHSQKCNHFTQRPVICNAGEVRNGADASLSLNSHLRQHSEIYINYSLRNGTILN